MSCAPNPKREIVLGIPQFDLDVLAKLGIRRLFRHAGDVYHHQLIKQLRFRLRHRVEIDC